MKINVLSYWEIRSYGIFGEHHEFMREVERLDRAHKRAKRELSKQQKALAKKNEYIKCYKEMYDNLAKQYSRLERTLIDIQDSGLEQCEQSIRQVNDISNLELKIVCLEQENKALKEQQTNNEKKVQERIIQSMSDTIVELRERLNETEEKYNELLKHIINEK